MIYSRLQVSLATLYCLRNLGSSWCYIVIIINFVSRVGGIGRLRRDVYPCILPIIYIMETNNVFYKKELELWDIFMHQEYQEAQVAHLC